MMIGSRAQPFCFLSDSDVEDEAPPVRTQPPAGATDSTPRPATAGPDTCLAAVPESAASQDEQCSDDARQKQQQQKQQKQHDSLCLVPGSQPYPASEDEVADSWLLQIAPPGMRNHINTCYMNAVLQVMLSLQPFTSALQALHATQPATSPTPAGCNTAPPSAPPHVSPTSSEPGLRRSCLQVGAVQPEEVGALLRHTSLTQALAVCLEELQAATQHNLSGGVRQASISPLRVKRCMRGGDWRSSSHQQDAHEFLVALMQNMLAEVMTAQYKASVLKSASCMQTACCQEAPGAVVHTPATQQQQSEGGGGGGGGGGGVKAGGVQLKALRARLGDVVCPGVRTFHGCLQHTYVCSACGYESHTKEQFSHLSLKIPHPPEGAEPHELPTLRDLLDAHFQDEVVDKTCDACQQQHVNHTARHQLCRLPPVLALQLKRFAHAQEDGVSRYFKLQSVISLPRFSDATLDLGCYCCPDAHPHTFLTQHLATANTAAPTADGDDSDQQVVVGVPLAAQGEACGAEMAPQEGPRCSRQAHDELLTPGPGRVSAVMQGGQCAVGREESQLGDETHSAASRPPSSPLDSAARGKRPRVLKSRIRQLSAAVTGSDAGTPLTSVDLVRCRQGGGQEDADVVMSPGLRGGGWSQDTQPQQPGTKAGECHESLQGAASPLNTFRAHKRSGSGMSGSGAHKVAKQHEDGTTQPAGRMLTCEKGSPPSVATPCRVQPGGSLPRVSSSAVHKSACVLTDIRPRTCQPGNTDSSDSSEGPPLYDGPPVYPQAPSAADNQVADLIHDDLTLDDEFEGHIALAVELSRQEAVRAGQAADEADAELQAAIRESMAGHDAEYGNGDADGSKVVVASDGKPVTCRGDAEVAGGSDESDKADSSCDDVGEVTLIEDEEVQEVATSQDHHNTLCHMALADRPALHPMPVAQWLNMPALSPGTTHTAVQTKSDDKPEAATAGHMQLPPPLPLLSTLAHYSLRGAVCHRGSTPFSGHYVAHALLPVPPRPVPATPAGAAPAGSPKAPATPLPAWQWWRYDDTEVTPVTAARARQEMGKTGYLLFLVAQSPNAGRQL